MPLTPVELFRRGIEITQQIRGKIEDTRAYYLGRSSREPEEPLSEVFDPEAGLVPAKFLRIAFAHEIARRLAHAAYRVDDLGVLADDDVPELHELIEVVMLVIAKGHRMKESLASHFTCNTFQ